MIRPAASHSLPMIDDEERRQILANGCGPRAEPADALCIHRLFEMQAGRCPDTVAVESEGRSLTYRQLNERSNQLARELRALGVGPDVLVGIGMTRSLDLAVGLLGILKAGGAFVPLDPDYPPDRLGAMLEDSQVGVLLTQEHQQERWPSTGAAVIRLDTDWETIDRHPASNLDDSPTPENAAYVIYTSGSTGEPRGVVVRHGGLVNHSLAVAAMFDLSPADRALQFSLARLRHRHRGAVPRLDPRGRRRVPRRAGPARTLGILELGRREADHRPRPADGLLARLGRGPGQPRRAGPRIAPPGDRRGREGVGQAIRGLVHHRRRPDRDGSTPMGRPRPPWLPRRTSPGRGHRPGPCSPNCPIGHPIANTQVYLLDAHLQLVPLGLRRRVVHRRQGAGPMLPPTARPDCGAVRPRSPRRRPGARLYRTGDTARWRPDGQPRVPRADRSPGEDPRLPDRARRGRGGSAAPSRGRRGGGRAREDAAGNQRLVAYVVPRPAAELDVAELRRWLQAELPEHMVPSAFVRLEALPLSSNGKIDRKALPDPGPGPLDSVAEYVAPRNPLEETLARVWAEVLELERVGVHDNFFDLGGHSLQSVQLVSRLTAALNRPVSVKTVFQAPTVAAMAEVLEREAAAAGSGDRLHRNGDAPAALARWLLESEPAVLPDHVTTERRPFLSLFASAELAPVESVALGYLPSALLHFAGLDRATVIHAWCGNRPLITEVRETPLGRIGSVLIPRFDDQLYHDRRDLLAVLGDAVQIAHEIGAATVSLTGLLPSASDYGRDLAKALAGHDLPRITTGHATTTSAVVLAVRRALEEGGRALAGEHVGFIGLGSVGLATLRLLLSCLPHPARLSLCDVYSKQEILESLRRELSDELGYGGEVRLLVSRHEVPAELYEASLIVGATNVAEILDIDRVAPGTIVVDDSAPTPSIRRRRFGDSASGATSS